MFSSSSANTTGRNILDTECFGINLVDSSIVSRVYQCISWSGSERIEKSGFTLTQASKISAPLVKESRAHLECSLYSYKDIGDNLVFFGEIVAASIWEEILRVEHAERYKLLDQVVFLENGIYSKVENSVRIDKGGR
jgi:flavin reductase (DIM6/NTAB) family NADH-FMN oxidoreductase RutF